MKKKVHKEQHLTAFGKIDYGLYLNFKLGYEWPQKATGDEAQASLRRTSVGPVI